jgi:hypothetical protein
MLNMMAIIAGRRVLRSEGLANVVNRLLANALRLRRATSFEGLKRVSIRQSILIDTAFAYKSSAFLLDFVLL